MSTEAIAAQAAQASMPMAQPALGSVALSMTQATSTMQAPSQSFGQWVDAGLSQVNQQLITGQADLQKLALGDTQNLHQVMIGMEETRLSFQLLMQVRNRVLEAYQDVMKMQV